MDAWIEIDYLANGNAVLIAYRLVAVDESPAIALAVFGIFVFGRFLYLLRSLLGGDGEGIGLLLPREAGDEANVELDEDLVYLLLWRWFS